MDKMRLLLSLVTIAIIVGPIAGILIMYQNNLLGLFIPPEVNEIADKLNSIGPDGFELEPVGSPQYDEASRTMTLTFQFKNTSPFDISFNSISGNVECAVHNSFHLGTVTLDEPVSIGVGETKTITVLITWTEAAISHFQTAHAGEETVVVNLVGFTVDVKGIQFQMDQTMEIPNPVA
jgi:hypothetical protein